MPPVAMSHIGENFMSTSSRQQEPSGRSRRDRQAVITTVLALPALLTAYFLQPDIQALGPTERVGLLTATMFGLIIIAEAYERYRKRWHYISAVTVSASLVVGAYLICMYPQIRSGTANKARCLAIQKDMLSSMPLRSDDADLFQALGCRPQGGGSVYAHRPQDEAERDRRLSVLPYRKPAVP